MNTCEDRCVHVRTEGKISAESAITVFYLSVCLSVFLCVCVCVCVCVADRVPEETVQSVT